MKNLTEYNKFKELRNTIKEQVEETVEEQVEEQVEEAIEEDENIEVIEEGAQLFDDAWKVRTRVEIPTSLINAYVKKVQAETGEDPRKKWSEQELAEEITKYVSTSFMSVENLPSSIVSNIDQSPQVQVQEEMPMDTEVETQVQEPEVQVEEAPEGQEVVQAPQGQGQPQAQEIAQEVPQGQPQVQGGQPAQEI